ncbi:MAG: hypothetical protein Q4A75_08605 [Peptostreptococcaceae bacterium]|nr:hypothetical protein [Peptostreptococcaceae bacterium]
MKKRKGMLLPLVVVVVAFIMILGGVGLSVASSGQKQSYGNLGSMQAYYMARAGIEMGIGFLYSPSDLANQHSANWFQKGKSSQPITTIENELRARTNDTPQELEVYVTSTGQGKNRQLTDSKIYAVGSADPRVGEKLGDISVTVTLEKPSTGTPKKKECFYRIVSTATFQNKYGVAESYSMTMRVSLVNEFDRDLRLGGA